MAHWNDERDKRWVEMMQKCGTFALKHRDSIDKFKETGNLIYWSAFCTEIRKELPSKRSDSPEPEQRRSRHIHD